MLRTLPDAAAESELAASLQEFWTQIEQWLSIVPTVLTTTGDWVRPAECVLLLSPAEVSSIPVLESLGLSIVDEGLRPYQNILRSKAVAVQPLAIEQIAEAFIELGLNETTVKAISRTASSTWRDAMNSGVKQVFSAIGRKQTRGF